jgi:Ohr subfamily peroxiredoxin
MKVLYTAEVTSVGGRAGHVKSSDGSLDVDLVPPPVMGGPGKAGVNPEQLFAAGYAACFSGAMAYTAAQQKIVPGEITIKSHVDLGPRDNDLPGFTVGVAMDITVANLDQAAAEKLVHEAHEVCPYSNATRGNIDVKLTAHGGK